MANAVFFALTNLFTFSVCGLLFSCVAVQFQDVTGQESWRVVSWNGRTPGEVQNIPHHTAAKENNSTKEQRFHSEVMNELHVDDASAERQKLKSFTVIFTQCEPVDFDSQWQEVVNNGNENNYQYESEYILFNYILVANYLIECNDTQDSIMDFISDFPETEYSGPSLVYFNFTDQMTQKQITAFVDEKFTRCTKFPLDDNSRYRVFLNGTIHIAIRNTTYDCIPMDDDIWYYRDSSLVYATYGGLGASIVCLLLHFITFLYIRKTRNFPGWNLCSLSVALFLAYSFFLIGQVPQIVDVPCIVISVIIYYSFLVAFFWMSVIAFDILKMLLNGTRKQLKPQRKLNLPIFVKYSAFCWGGPVVPVAAAVISDTTDKVPMDYRPDFGTAACWINNPYGLLIYFASLVFFSIAANLVMFAWSTYILATKRMSINNNQKRCIKREVFLHFKLAIIMGMTWIIGVIASAVEVTELWYVFIIFNTLQGCFIFLLFSFKQFVAFICRKCKPTLNTKRFSGKFSTFSSSYKSSTVVTQVTNELKMTDGKY